MKMLWKLSKEARVLFRFLSNFLAHKAAWYLVGDLRTRTYDKLERMHLGFFMTNRRAI